MFSAAVAAALYLAVALSLALYLALARVNILWSVDCRRVRRGGDRWVHVQKHKQPMQSLSRHACTLNTSKKFQSTLF